MAAAAAALREKVRQRFNRTGAAAPSQLELELRRATHSDELRVPEDAVATVVRASHEGEEERRTIMLHIHGCLNDASSSVWRRVHAGMILLEALLEKGSPEVVSESARGVHFDLSQRLGFLEKYEFGQDARVQALLRKKAAAIRTAWMDRQLKALDGLCDEPRSCNDEAPRQKPSPPPPADKESAAPLDLLNDEAEATTDGGESATSASSSSRCRPDPSPQASSRGLVPPPPPPPPPDALDLFGEAPPATLKPPPPPPLSASSPAAATAAVDLLDMMAPEASKPPPPSPVPSLASVAAAASAAPAAQAVAPAVASASSPARSVSADWLKLAESQGIVLGEAPAKNGDLLSMCSDAPSGAASAPPIPTAAEQAAAGGWGMFAGPTGAGAGGASSAPVAAAAGSGGNSLLDF